MNLKDIFVRSHYAETDVFNHVNTGPRKTVNACTFSPTFPKTVNWIFLSRKPSTRFFRKPSIAHNICRKPSTLEILDSENRQHTFPGQENHQLSILSYRENRQHAHCENLPTNSSLMYHWPNLYHVKVPP